MSMPTSAMAATAAVLTCGRVGAAGEHLDPVAGEVAEPAGRHLGAAGVVHAQEQHGRLVQLADLEPGEGAEPIARETLDQHG